MKETIDAIKKQFEALSAKIDPASAEMLQDRDYATQLADCVAKTYVMLNSGMCEEVTVCHTCAQQRDFMREALEKFESIAQNEAVDFDVEAFYFGFVKRLNEIKENIQGVMGTL